MTTIALDRFPTFATLKEIINADGYALSRLAGQPVDGCAGCGKPEASNGHIRRGLLPHHPYRAPDAHLRKLRILARRHLTETTARHREAYQRVEADTLAWVAARDAGHDTYMTHAEGLWIGETILDNGQWRRIASVRAVECHPGGCREFHLDGDPDGETVHYRNAALVPTLTNPDREAMP